MHKKLMWMEVHIHNVKSQAGNIWVKDMATQKVLLAKRKSARNLKNLCILSENSAEGLGSRREHCWGYVSIYENIPEKLLHLPPKSCHSFT